MQQSSRPCLNFCLPFSLSFHSKCGLNIIMDASCITARRKARYNEGLVFSRKPLANKEMFQVRSKT